MRNRRWGGGGDEREGEKVDRDKWPLEMAGAWEAASETAPFSSTNTDWSAHRPVIPLHSIPSLSHSFIHFFFLKETTTGLPNSLQRVIYGMLMWLQANLCCEQFNFNTARVLGTKQLRRELKNHLKGPPITPPPPCGLGVMQWRCFHASTIKKRESPKINNGHVSLSFLCSF